MNERKKEKIKGNRYDDDDVYEHAWMHAAKVSKIAVSKRAIQQR